MTIAEKQQKIIQEHGEALRSNNKHNYLIKLGLSRSPIELKYKTEDNLVKGCQVKTWFCATYQDNKVYYHIDSSSVMIRGIISLLVEALSGQEPKDIIQADLYFIERLGLKDDFSPVRANSLRKLVNQIKSAAASYINNN